MPGWMFLGLLVIAIGVAVLLKREMPARAGTPERLDESGQTPRRWWQHKWYFFLPVVFVLGASVYFAAAGEWKIAALYFAAAALYAFLQRRKWERYGNPSSGDR